MTQMSSSIEDLYVCIFIIERYCMLHDICINAKKTKWMLFGEPRSILTDEIKVNDILLEKVSSFKFLGVIISQDSTFAEHVSKRKALFASGLGEIQRLGFNKREIPVKMKKVLYTALVRSKLIYGLETIKMKDSTQKRTFKSLEGNCLKTASGVNFRSKTASLSYGMGITLLGLYIHKRKLCFILVLLKNTATDELIYRGTHETLGDIIEKMGVRGEDIGKGPEQYRWNCLCKQTQNDRRH